MTIEQITTFLAWNSVVHIAVLLLATVLLKAGRGSILGIHQAMFAVEKDELNKIYLGYLAVYKLLILVFCLVPYLVLQAMF